VFSRPVFHEALLRLPTDADEVLKALAARDLLGGYAVMRDYLELENCVLVCATETRSDEDIESYVSQLARILSGKQA
jgi:glycine dehydrogenase subunit 1